MLILEGLIGLHRTIQLQLLQHYWSEHPLDYCDIEWFALETNRDHSVVFEFSSKYCISDSFVDYDGYSTSSKEINRNLIKDLLIMALPLRKRHRFPLISHSHQEASTSLFISFIRGQRE